jgi:5-methylcytosine-specific restriction enzyme A
VRIGRLPGIHYLICKAQGRSGKWPRVRKEHLATHPRCEVCGEKKDSEVHHIQAYRERPELELDPNNLITLCNRHGHHLLFGHLMDFRSVNRNVVRDATMWHNKIKARP